MNINLKEFSITECIHGTMVWPKDDAIIGQCLTLYGEWSEGENIIMSRFISEGDIVIDMGANIGTTVLSLSKQVGNQGRVIAFEPQNLMSQCLHTNLTLNDITNVAVENAAVSNKSGWARINDARYAKVGRYGEAGIAKEGTKVRTIKLDDIEVPRCNLIKIDIEGHELQAIKGGESFLKKHRPTLYMEAKKNIPETKKYMKWLFDNNWSCYWHFASWFRENNYKRNNNNIFQGTGDMNILAQPNEKLQPNNLLKLKDYKEDWNPKDLLNFYKSSKIDFV